MSFESGVFQTAFAWYQQLWTAGWRWLSGESENSLYTFLAAHWKALTLGIMAAAVVIDFVVYLVRWRPYRVWISFFRRLARPGRSGAIPLSDGEEPYDEEADEPVGPAGMAPAYDEPFAPPAAPSYPAPPFPALVPPASVPDRMPAAEPARVPYGAYAEPTRPVSAPPAPPAERPPYDDPDEEVLRSRRSGGRRTGARRGGLLSAINPNTDTMPRLRYVPPTTAQDAGDAYREPYIPPQWQDPGNVGAAAQVRHRRSEG